MWWDVRGPAVRRRVCLVGRSGVRVCELLRAYDIQRAWVGARQTSSLTTCALNSVNKLQCTSEISL